MANPALIGDGQINDRYGQNADEARPGNLGYIAPIPTGNDNITTDEKPALVVDLTSLDSPEAKEITKVILEGNTVDTVTIQIKDSDTQDFTDLFTRQPLDQRGSVNLPNGVEAEMIRVVFNSPTKAATEYKVNLKIHVCGHFERPTVSSTTVRETTAQTSAATVWETTAQTSAGTSKANT